MLQFYTGSMSIYFKSSLQFSMQVYLLVHGAEVLPSCAVKAALLVRNGREDSSIREPGS